jgi:restriction system protein
MPIPDYQTLMLPLLQIVADGETHAFAEVVDALAKKFRLTDDEVRQLLPSGRYPTFRSRVSWARTYMAKAGLLASQKRAHFNITPAGTEVLAGKPSRIDVAFLRRFPSFVAFQSIKHDGESEGAEVALVEATESPEELIESAHAELKRTLASDLLSKIRGAAPYFSKNWWSNCS